MMSAIPFDINWATIFFAVCSILFLCIGIWFSGKEAGRMDALEGCYEMWKTEKWKADEPSQYVRFKDLKIVGSTGWSKEVIKIRH